MVANLPDGTFDLVEVEAKIRHGYPDAHYPRSRLVCVENTHNIQGGRVLPLTFLQEVRPLWSSIEPVFLILRIVCSYTGSLCVKAHRTTIGLQ